MVSVLLEKEIYTNKIKSLIIVLYHVTHTRGIIFF